jgi:hypothetical protein
MQRRECYGSTTFKRQDMQVGIEPNNCFYIQNYRLMIGRKACDGGHDLGISRLGRRSIPIFGTGAKTELAYQQHYPNPPRQLQQVLEQVD